MAVILTTCDTQVFRQGTFNGIKTQYQRAIIWEFSSLYNQNTSLNILLFSNDSIPKSISSYSTNESILFVF